MSYGSHHFIPVGHMQPMVWDSMLDQQMTIPYNQANQNQRDFYPTFESSNASSPSSVSSSLRSTDTRKSSTTSSPNQVTKGAVPDRVERRREQNRQSQRAYRDRKEKHQRELEDQIAVWQAKHDKLTKSYTAQSEEVLRLKARIQELNSQLKSQQSPSELDNMWSGMTMSQSPSELDFVSWDDDAWARHGQQ